ncbi:hypothetical protein [Microbacterium sp.]|uniref:hypothetical protein n=1 Tax=Microbacterium sp. TaxID=51671 RepID=UPI0039E46EF2
MTEYIYQLKSNVPLMAVNGIGNQPIVCAGQYGQGLVRRDVEQIAVSNGAASADGHRLVLELLERREGVSS